MKANLVMLSLFFVVQAAGSVDVYAQQDWREEYYNKWHQLLADNPIINDIQFWFDTEHNPNKDYVTTLNHILKNKYDMLDYLCNRIADKPSPILHTLYADVYSLDKLGSVCLYCGVTYVNGVDNRISFVQNVPTFQNEWREGLYKAPDETVRQLCKKLMANKDNEMNGKILAPILRFGIYAAPELVRQVKLNNSNYAFAALLRIMNFKEVSDFISDRNEGRKQYLEKSSKMDAISKWYKENKDADHSLGIMKKVGEILGE
jgi:hypothetical protein